MKIRFLQFIILVFTFYSCKDDSVITAHLIYNAEESSNINRRITHLKEIEDNDIFKGKPLLNKEWRIFKLESQSYGDLHVLSSTEGEDITIVIDRNNDLDFSNDKEIHFKDFKKLNKSEVAKSTQIKNNNLTYTKNKNQPIKLYPIPNYFTNSSDSLSNILQIVAEPIGVYQGVLEEKNEKYRISTKHPLRDKAVEFIIEKLDYDKTKLNEDFSIPYLLEDKILLNGKYYILNDYDFNTNKLQLLESNQLDEIGFRKGFKIENLDFSIIDNSKLTIEEIIGNNDYLLIDFWGTWCAPCIKLMPELKKIHKTKNNINVLGIALDENEYKVEKFLNKKEIFYTNTFISFEDAKLSESLINRWRIPSFPYYVLIDKNKNIIARGSGEKFLDNLKYINKK